MIRLRTRLLGANRPDGRLDSERRSCKVRLLIHPLWRRRCLKTHPSPRRPLGLMNAYNLLAIAFRVPPAAAKGA